MHSALMNPFEMLSEVVGSGPNLVFFGAIAKTAAVLGSPACMHACLMTLKIFLGAETLSAMAARSVAFEGFLVSQDMFTRGVSSAPELDAITYFSSALFLRTPWHVEHSLEPVSGEMYAYVCGHEPFLASSGRWISDS